MARRWWVGAFLIAACGRGAPGGRESPADAAPVDASSPDGSSVLAQLCGAVPVTLEDWERCYRKRRCEAYVACTERNEFRDVAECLELMDAVSGGKLAAEERERARAVTQGRARIDAAAFEACLVETAPDRCHTRLFVPACAVRFAGTVPDEGACLTDIECQSPGAPCERTCADACCQGVCKRRVAVGGACNRFLGVCEPGLVCSSRTLTCWRGDVGATCEHFSECDPDASCDLEAKVCKGIVARGQPCIDHWNCDGESSCVGGGLTSEPQLCRRINQAGDVCGDACYGSLYCKLPDFTSLGVCTPIPEHGEPCAFDLPCRGATEVCWHGRCETRLAEGASCPDEICHPGLFCAGKPGDPDRRCTRPQPEGAPCTARRQCQSYLCSGTEATPGACLPWREACPRS